MGTVELLPIGGRYQLGELSDIRGEAA